VTSTKRVNDTAAKDLAATGISAAGSIAAHINVRVCDIHQLRASVVGPVHRT